MAEGADTDVLGQGLGIVTTGAIGAGAGTGMFNQVSCLLGGVHFCLSCTCGIGTGMLVALVSRYSPDQNQLNDFPDM